MQTAQITIQGHEFNAPMPYTEGHVLNENEAGAFNQLFHENLRNNFAKTVKEAKEKAEKEGTPLNLAALQGQFDGYAAEYKFGARRVGGGGDTSLPKDPVERQAHIMARETIREKAKAKGIKVTAEWIASKVPEFLSKNPAYMAEAQRRVDSAKAISSEEIDFSDAQAPQTSGSTESETPDSPASEGQPKEALKRSRRG